MCVCYSVDNKTSDSSNIINNHKYLMKKHSIKIFLGLIKKMFIRLLTGLVNTSNHIKCISLRNQKCEIQITPINLHPNEYSQGLHYYPFKVNLDRCVGRCHTLNDLPKKVCVPKETEDLNLRLQE